MTSRSIASRARELVDRFRPDRTATNLFAVGGAAVALLAGGSHDRPESSAHSAFSDSCDVRDPNANTLVCYQSKEGVVSDCLIATHQTPSKYRAGYEGSSREQFAVSFRLPNIKGCAPAGVRKVTVVQELRKGSSDTYEKNSNTYTKKTNKPFVVSTRLKAPYNCGDPGMAGSRVRTVTTLTWVPRKGWPVRKGAKLARTITGNPRTIC